MKAQDKAIELMSAMMAVCETTDKAKVAALIVCTEILETKNYPNTLHPEMTQFSNAYWEQVVREIFNYKVQPVCVHEKMAYNTGILKCTECGYETLNK